MSGISRTSLEPSIDLSNGESLNDSSPQHKDFGDTKEQTGSEVSEAEEISDNGSCEANQKVDPNLDPLKSMVEKTSGFAESNDHVAKADDSLPVIKHSTESSLPDPGPLLRCPYLDEISDSNTRYIIKVHSFIC